MVKREFRAVVVRGAVRSVFHVLESDLVGAWSLSIGVSCSSCGKPQPAPFIRDMHGEEPVGPCREDVIAHK